MSNIKDKVVVITGASSGIGESTAKLLAERGARVVLGARRLNRINAVAQEISASGGKAIGFACDVTKRAEVESLIQKAVDSLGRVDVIVNNAGIMPIASNRLKQRGRVRTSRRGGSGRDSSAEWPRPGSG